MIVLVGESASGKSTVERNLCKEHNYERIISYTTRPQREYEIDREDYFFISEEYFLRLLREGYFAEHTKYRAWHYGTAKKDCTVDKVIVTNPHGLRQLKRLYGDKVVSFYLRVDEKERLIRLVKRGDDLMECFRRIISDQGVFQNVEDECDYSIDCTGLTPASASLAIHMQVCEHYNKMNKNNT